jgi:hypothetical protein
VTVPMPVKVSVEPLIVPGPEITEKLTGNPELAVADSATCAALNGTGAVGAKAIVCDIGPDEVVACEDELQPGRSDEAVRVATP